MELEEFRKELIESNSIFSAWGSYVLENVKSISESCSVAIQIISSRVKDIDSAIGKLSRKSYSDPMKEMTDLVGVRVVCLLTPDTTKLAASISSHEHWNAQVSRNTSQEAEDSPDQFGYQSLHFEIRAKIDTQTNGILIPIGTCCELQVRTLMQHAYAEVVHDSVYKSSWDAPSRALRFISSSAALIETADHLFCETMSLLEQENRVRGELLEQLTHLYDSKVQSSGGKDQKFNMAVLQEFERWIDESTIDKVAQLIKDKPFIAERIKSRTNIDAFWSQPVSLLAYWLAMEMSTIAREEWPFAQSADALGMVFSDLGKRYAV